jgi:DNA-binding transcriptional ArsR family regulator
MVDKVKAKFDPQSVIDAQVESINRAIAEIDKRMKPYEALAEKKLQLVSARRALLGTGNRMTSNSGTRVTLDDIVQFLNENPGASPGQIAENFGVTQGTVSSHLYRNKDRFVRNNGSYWVRDPEKGINSPEDVKENDED